MGLAEAVGDRNASRAFRLLEEAQDAYLSEMFPDVIRTLSQLSRQAPDVPEVRELHGLALYRLGKWAGALKELEEAQALSPDVTRNPVIMDCERALENHGAVKRLWTQLGRVSPDPATMAEGRIVAAGSLADQGDLRGAISMLRQGFRKGSRPAVHHLRRAYALADLLERSGEHVEARELFAWIAGHDRTFGDSARRASALGT